ncbi:MAG: iron-containing alcohol dehydrogenase family protein [Candidatus Caenarcaniphilales bacterium]|nr:iron-containing alcohol dehydrogenase family protein [Candidatus Caenarcaniphilales bacterium]
MKIHVPSLLRTKPKALDKLGKYSAQLGFKKIILFLGEGIENLLGERIFQALKDKNIEILQTHTIATSDVKLLFDLSLQIKDYSANAIVAVGGGKVIDCAKYVSSISKLPFLVVPTITSNDGFCSPVASLNVDDKKKSFKTDLPKGVVIDTEIIKNAPKQFFFSGVGDLLSKYTSIFDWKLAYHHTGEYVDDFAVAISQNSLEAFVNYPNKDPQDLKLLTLFANSLLMSGIAMEVAGSSRPASGSEHLISHSYDQISEKPLLHGIQVGIASYASSFVQEKTHKLVKDSLVNTGLYDFIVNSGFRLNKHEFIESIKKAPEIKKNFFTILSMENQTEKLIDFINKDPMMNNMLN